MQEAPKRTKCPQCEGTAVLAIPLKKATVEQAVYGCSACGYTFTHDGRAFVDSSEKLREVFRGATQGNQVLTETMKGQNMSPATRALLLAQIMEYGIQMYYDGLKQGLLLYVTQEEYRNDGKNVDRPRQSEEGTARGGSPADAGNPAPHDHVGEDRSGATARQ